MSGSNYAHCDAEPCLMPDGSTKVLYIGDDDIPATTVIRHGVCDVARLAVIEAALLARLTEVEGERDERAAYAQRMLELAGSWEAKNNTLAAENARLRQQLDEV